MTWQNSPCRAYYTKYQRIHASADAGGWYQVYRLPGDVYAIAEPDHIQEVNAYLIMGQRRALLLDTGMGIFPLRPLVRELLESDKSVSGVPAELDVVCSHLHSDHIGGAHEFGTVWCWPDETMHRNATCGLCLNTVADQALSSKFRFGHPEGFQPEAFEIRPFETRPLAKGHVFDLGGRQLRVLHTPGHSSDSVMLHDAENGILFTGDTFYPGALYAHLAGGRFGYSDLKKYRDSLQQLIETLPQHTRLYCGHNEFYAPFSALKEAADLLVSILDAGCPVISDPSLGITWTEGGRQISERKGNGFSVIYACR